MIIYLIFRRTEICLINKLQSTFDLMGCINTQYTKYTGDMCSSVKWVELIYDLRAEVPDSRAHSEGSKSQRLRYLSTATLHDNHSTTDIKLSCVNLSTTYPQAICRKTPITQSFKVSNWGPSVWICYCQFWFKDEDNMRGCSLLLTLQGICAVNRMDAQPLVQRPPTEPARHRVIILILLHWLITMLAVHFCI